MQCKNPDIYLLFSAQYDELSSTDLPIVLSTGIVAKRGNGGDQWATVRQQATLPADNWQCGSSYSGLRPAGATSLCKC